MRVLVSPRAGRGAGRPGEEAARTLAGEDGEVVYLAKTGVGTLSRPLSGAEVALLRAALAGAGPVVGYVCLGAALGRAGMVAVSDHANLTWCSPLTGPNDDSVGPRFPSMTGVYAPQPVLDRLAAGGGMIVEVGVVAGVRDESRPTSYENEVVAAQEFLALSEELVAVAIIAAHMGLRLAAVVLAAGPEQRGEF